jgi:hypothetical protein
MRRAIQSVTVLLLCLGMFACGPGLVSGDVDGERAGSAFGKGDAMERLEGVVQVRPTFSGGYAPHEHGVGWLYSREGAALQPVNWASWRITLDQKQCWFHESLEFPIGDEVHHIKGHVCVAVLEPAPPPLRYVMVGMVFSDGSGTPVPVVQGDSYHVAGPKSLYERIASDCWGEGSPGDRVEDVDSRYDPAQTVECTNADGVLFTYFAFLPKK